MIALHQAFYGRGQTGYRLLASSYSDFNQKIEQLCTSIGTPDGTSTFESFFLNFIEGNNRFMVQCCLGNPDEAGRKTLFFHVLIGNHYQLQQARMGIASLIRNKLFESKLPSGPILDVSIEEESYSLPWGNQKLSWNNEKFAIISNKPELSLLTGTLRGDIDNISWASFSFRSLDNFDVYVLSEYVPRPNDRKCVNPDGTIAVVPQKMQKPSQSSVPVVKQPIYQKSSNIKSIFLAMSLIVNCILCYLLIQSKTVQVPKDNVTNPTKPPEQVVVNNFPDRFTKEEVIQELRDNFIQKYEIIEGSWEDQMEQDPILKRNYFDLKKYPLRLASGYVQFVNSEILEKSKDKNGK